MEKDEFFKLIQEFIKYPPVVIWGSGATIGYGMPSMVDLNTHLQSKLKFFNKTNTNLEKELGKKKYESKLNEIRKIIWEHIAEKDKEILKDMLDMPKKYDGIISLVKKITETQPYVCNIITTNYDRVLENLLDFHNLAYTDGFTGRFLSLFNEELFRQNNFKNPKSAPFVNLVKVHGSLNWFAVDGKIRYFDNSKPCDPQIIPPGNNKYRQAYSEPYRSLIQISDKTIEKSQSFLVVGFGFNDEHLTPKITERIKDNIPIVIITKKITKETQEQLSKASIYLGIEQGSDGKTKISYKSSISSTELVEEINGSFWQLDNFMEALNGGK